MPIKKVLIAIAISLTVGSVGALAKYYLYPQVPIIFGYDAISYIEGLLIGITVSWVMFK